MLCKLNSLLLALNYKMMKKFILIALLFAGITGTTTILAQTGPKSEKKEMKADKKEKKVEKKEFKGKEKKEAKKTEKAEKKEVKKNVKEAEKK